MQSKCNFIGHIPKTHMDQRVQRRRSRRRRNNGNNNVVQTGANLVRRTRNRISVNAASGLRRFVVERRLAHSKLRGRPFGLIFRMLITFPQLFFSPEKQTQTRNSAPPPLPPPLAASHASNARNKLQRKWPTQALAADPPKSAQRAGDKLDSSRRRGWLSQQCRRAAQATARVGARAD